MVSADQAALVIVDIQGKLAQAMAEKELFIANVTMLLRGARILGLPLIITEQTPEKLGPTIPELVPFTEGIRPIWKENFSCMAALLFQQELAAAGRRVILLAGIETHVCVYQTAMDLMDAEYQVQVVTDCVSSRTLRNRDLALQRMEQEGARLTTTEMVLFELLQTAAHAKAREIFRLVK